MFPIRDDNPHFLTPYVTYALIIANVLAWLLIQGLGFDPLLSRSVCTLRISGRRQGSHPLRNPLLRPVVDPHVRP